MKDNENKKFKPLIMLYSFQEFRKWSRKQGLIRGVLKKKI